MFKIDGQEGAAFSFYIFQSISTSINISNPGPPASTLTIQMAGKIMAFTDIELQKVKKVLGGLCSENTPDHLMDQLRFEYEIEKQSVIIYEVRPAWKKPSEFTRMPLAKLIHEDNFTMLILFLPDFLEL